jgi:hypothetical protein
MADGAQTDPPQLTVDEARSWSGHKLDEQGGHSIGKVEGIYVDEKTGSPHWLHARMGRFGHHTLVPIRHAVEGIARVWVPYSRDEIRRAPRLEPGKTLDREAEQALVTHYGLDDGEGSRSAELAKREAGETTSRPSS